MYSKKVKSFFLKNKIDVFDSVSFSVECTSFVGVILPDEKVEVSDVVMFKLVSGYNIGFYFDSICDLVKVGRVEVSGGVSSRDDLKFNKKMPKVSLVATGGTISSRVDYKTGGVYMLMDPNEILKTTPELADIVNLDTILSPFKVASEDMGPKDWVIIAELIADRFNAGDVGVIVTHGTDTLHFTAAALSFLLKDFKKPVALVGAQRSPDRGSFDGSLNLLCSAQYVVSEMADTAVVMHGTMNDDYCLANKGTKVRKMHTSRRDAFRPINTLPIAKIWSNGKIENLSQFRVRDDSVKASVCGSMYEKVAIVSAYPGSDPGVIDYYVDKGYKGIILSASALGHVPGYTRDLKKSWLPSIKKAISSGVFVGCASQTLYGRVHPHVYRLLIEMDSMGVVFLSDMMVETAYVKLMWVLSMNKNLNKVKEMMLTNYVGEFNENLSREEFLY
jgi:glutamyl-tRNA(Gln) amidotransferase subunit D